VTNPNWGTKRLCQACGIRFYDMLKNPIVCPKCAEVYNPEMVLRSRRRNAAEDIKEEKSLAKGTDFDSDGLPLVAEDDLIASVLGDEDEDGDESFIEDPADLGDDDDMASDLDKHDE
jgi:uncharacterized protein (TIGR02300 family)